MPTLTPGDVVTFPLRGDRYGVALVVHVDDLALNDLYHFAVCDAVVEGADTGEDELGNPLPREHDMVEVEAARILFEHVALTRHGLEASELSVVGERPIGEEELEGYRTWLRLRYEDAIRRGAIRERIDDNPEQYDEALDEDVDDDAVGDESDESERAEEVADFEEVTGEEAQSEEGDASEEPASTAATLGVHDVALGTALLRMRSVFERESYRDAALSRYILGLGDDSAAIDEVIGRLLDGDFAAGDELIDYGEPGMRALGARLGDDIAPELADDILQVLVNSGEAVAYERVGAFMQEHGTRPDDPLYGSAVRAYCYAVMLTAGEPEPLKDRLSLLESVRTPELADDVRSAREALAGEG